MRRATLKGHMLDFAEENGIEDLRELFDEVENDFEGGEDTPDDDEDEDEDFDSDLDEDEE